jgi:hypothetical protein
MAGTKDMVPRRSCRWEYSEELGLAPFFAVPTMPDWDERFNPTITISRRGLTVRVVGTLSDRFVARYGANLERVVDEFPHLIPVRQTARHEVAEEDGRLPAAARPSRGETLATEVVDLPPNSVMIVYPVALADRASGQNSLAGNWRIEWMRRARPSNPDAAFGNFPFLNFTGENAHALHGPIYGTSTAWRVTRGEVSHGCARMQGEHVLELAVLLGCSPDHEGRCPGGESLPNVPVTVMEDFDHVPDPRTRVATGPVRSRSDFAEAWRAVDVDFPRERPVPAAFVTTVRGERAYRLERSVDPLRPGARPPAPPAVRVLVAPTWDNRDRAIVTGEGAGCS